jgi:hypothetical protein
MDSSVAIALGFLIEGALFYLLFITRFLHTFAKLRNTPFLPCSIDGDVLYT